MDIELNTDRYYSFARDELVELVPASSKRILDCGCAYGLFGKTLKTKFGSVVVGIEQSRKACQIARKNIDYIIHSDLNTFDFSTLETDFDLITFSDVLEHLLNPLETLKNAITKLKPDGYVLASIPNIAHPAIQFQLRKGLFRYTTAGILDNTHLRFFTQTTIFQLFTKADLKIVFFRSYPEQNNPIQFHILAHRITPQPKNPETTIIIPTLNCLNHTQLAYETLKESTTTPYKLIFVDNGSTDGTRAWLRSTLDVYHIENICNLGFSTSNNIALETVDTPYFVLSNNDVLFTPNWLDRLLNIMYCNPNLYILGPMSNYVSGPQLIQNLSFKSRDEIFNYSKSLHKDGSYYLTPARRVVFFCTLLRTALLNKIGFLDEAFGIGNFEDDDYCLRTIKAGFQCGIDKSTFIYHFGSRTFINNKIDYNKIMEQNKNYFLNKHKITISERSPLNVHGTSTEIYQGISSKI